MLYIANKTALNLSVQQHTAFVKQIATLLGFNYCGIARAQRLDDDARRLEAWLGNGYQGNMQYMENYFDLRIDPTRLVPGAKSVITLLLNYYPEQQQPTGLPKVAKYAYGKDYHKVIRNKLQELIKLVKTKTGDINGRGFVDSAPVLERSWRNAAGWAGLERTATSSTSKMDPFFLSPH